VVFIQPIQPTSVKLDEPCVQSSRFGEHIATIRIKNRHSNVGLALNPAASLMAVSNEDAHTVTLYSLPGGDKLKTIGGRIFGAFNHPMGICFTLLDTVLVADAWNSRIVEVATTGKILRTVAPTGRKLTHIYDVTCNAEVIVISQPTHADDNIVVLDLLSGNEVRKFGGDGVLRHCSCVRLTTDGNYIVALTKFRIVTFTISGSFVKSVSLAPYFVRDGQSSLCQSTTGDFILPIRVKRGHNIAMFSAVTGEVVGHFGALGEGNGQFCKPAAVVSGFGRLYVLDGESDRVQVFWM
jgi:DNA-binding beta-propeller fold protein YncE